MQLETPDGRLFSLTVDRYEFPEEEPGPTEDNPAEDFETDRFLVVTCRFRNADGEWSAGGPTMTTGELRQFADWLEAVRDGTASQTGVYFTERDLEFTVDDARANLRVHVSFGFLPEWAKEADVVTIELPLSCVDFDRVIGSLRTELKRFPGRGDCRGPGSDGNPDGGGRPASACR